MVTLQAPLVMKGRTWALRCPVAGGQGSGEHTQQRACSLLVRDTEREGDLGASQAIGLHRQPSGVHSRASIGNRRRKLGIYWVDSHWQSSVLGRRLEEAS